VQCPRCHRTEIGRIAAGPFYCWSCFLEFHCAGAETRCYELDEEGGLVPVALVPTAPDSEAGPRGSVPASADRQ